MLKFVALVQGKSRQDTAPPNPDKPEIQNIKYQNPK